MPNDDHAMCVFARLAVISAERQQPMGRNRFLVLTGIAATRAGYPEIAARCQQLIAASNPQHLVARFDSFAGALRDDNFANFAKQVRRFCSVEEAEHLLTQHGIDADAAVGSGDTEGATLGDQCLRLLAKMADSDTSRRRHGPPEARR